MNVLLVDDDPAFQRYASLALEEAGLGYRAVATASEALQVLSEPEAKAFDVVLLDIELPGIKGWEVLKWLRERGNQVPVIVVSVHETVEERVQGLGLGADDYLVKPFEFPELIARLKAVVRRGLRTKEVKVGPLEIDTELRQVRRDGVSIFLTPKEFEMLWVLAQAAGRTVSRKELLKRVWNTESDPETNVVEVHAWRLRRKLELGGVRGLFQTVRGSGYRLVL